MSTRRISSRHGIAAAVAAVGAAVAFGAVGVATAQAPPAEIIEAQAATWEPATVTITEGETVEWQFDESSAAHNARSTSSNWSMDSGFDREPEQYTFTEAGEYTFICDAHPATMTGSVTVEEGDPGEPTPTPTPDPDPTPTPTPDPDPTPTPTPQPSDPGTGGGGGGGSTTNPGMQHPRTPAPSIAASADTVAPAVGRISAKTLRHRRVRLRFSLSEPASVTIRFKRSGRKATVRTVRVMGHEGRNTVRVRSRAFKTGRRFVARLQARDALGNQSGTERKRLTIRRGSKGGGRTLVIRRGN